MNGISVKLPLKHDSEDGLYNMNKTKAESIKQDLKMLILTSPGERIMIPNYGVGLRNYLFQQNTQAIKTKISTRIQEQVSTYLSIVQLKSVIFGVDDNNENLLNVRITYSIPSFNVTDDIGFSLI